MVSNHGRELREGMFRGCERTIEQLVDPETDPDAPKTTWAYDPHIDPAVQFDVGRAGIERFIDDALASGDEATMRGALEELRRLSQP
jgi:adenine-specific DNA-methyltransferase